MADSRLLSAYNQVFPNTLDKLCDFYDQWADTYDKEYKQFGYEGPRITAETLMKFLNDKSAKILDFASGTGMVGEQLKAYGFSNVDGVDMSRNSLKTCQEKQVYRSLICQKIGPSPLSLNSKTYDALVTCGAFVPGHLNQSCFPEMTRLVKPGGFIVLTIREEYLWTAEEYQNNKLEDSIQGMVEERKWEVLSRNIYQRHFNDKAGITFVFKVLK